MDDNIFEDSPIEGQSEESLDQPVAESVESDSPTEGQSQEETPTLSAYEQLKSKKNWQTEDDVAKGYSNVEARMRQLENELNQYKQGNQTVQEEDDDELAPIIDRIASRVEERVQRAITPLQAQVYGSQLDNVEKEVAQAVGPQFETLKDDPMYQQIRGIALNSENPTQVYQGLVLGFLGMAQKLTGGSQNAFQAGVQTGQQLETAKAAAHMLGNSGASTPITDNEPPDEGDAILQFARTAAGKGTLGV